MNFLLYNNILCKKVNVYTLTCDLRLTIGYTLRMKNVTFFIVAIAFLPSLAYAQSAQVLIKNVLLFINSSLIPFALGIGFLFFTINVIRYFVIGGSNEEGREKAKNLALYSVLAFTIIVIFYGIVNMIANSIGLEGKDAPPSDYVELHSV